LKRGHSRNTPEKETPMSTETSHLEEAIPASAFSDLMGLVRLAGDPKAFQARLDALTAASAKLKEQRAADERLAKARTAALDQREAAIAKLEAETSAAAQEWANRKAEVDRKTERLDEIRQGIENDRCRLNSRMLAFANLTRHPLQDEPSDAQIDAEVFGRPRNDAHFDEDPASPGHGRIADDTAYAVPAPDRVSGSTLTHSRASRRAEQRP
jgi:hypothetical protein